MPVYTYLLISGPEKINSFMEASDLNDRGKKFFGTISKIKISHSAKMSFKIAKKNILNLKNAFNYIKIKTIFIHFLSMENDDAIIKNNKIPYFLDPEVVFVSDGNNKFSLEEFIQIIAKDIVSMEIINEPKVREL